MFGFFYSMFVHRIWAILTILACVVRVTTQYVYAKAFQGGFATEWHDKLYYQGQAFFELICMLFLRWVAAMYFNKYACCLISFFMWLCVFSFIKETVFNPLQWFPGEEKALKVSVLFTITELFFIYKNITINKFLHLIKLLR